MSSRSKDSCSSVLLEELVFVALVKAADTLTLKADQFFKASGLSATQYNVLRILRGAEPQGLPCRGIGDRMITHDSDITRLLDRMEKRGLITRARQTDDRRVVKARITAAGLAALKTLDVPVREMHQRQLRHMSATQLKTLSNLLRDLQEGLSPAARDVEATRLSSKSH
ncbi:MAG: MarR family transcriptional regulator [Candidatus Acidiferrum sp.]|jgi:DNA-binding MarR family transcriptional regulator